MSEAQSRQLTLAQQRVAAMKKRKQEKEAAAKLFDVSAVTERLEASESEELDKSRKSRRNAFIGKIHLDYRRS